VLGLVCVFDKALEGDAPGFWGEWVIFFTT